MRTLAYVGRDNRGRYVYQNENGDWAGYEMFSPDPYLDDDSRSSVWLMPRAYTEYFGPITGEGR